MCVMCVRCVERQRRLTLRVAVRTRRGAVERDRVTVCVESDVWRGDGSSE